MAGTSHFDCFPSDFLNGIIGLKADQIAIYTVMMMMQYDAGEPIKFAAREREIAVRAGMSVGRARAAIAHLQQVGKLEPVDDALSNPRTVTELNKIWKRIAENRKNSYEGGIANRRNWEEKRNKINGNESRPDSQPDSQNIALLPPSTVPQPIEEDPSDLCSKPDKPVRTRDAYPEDFLEFWKAYPTDQNMPKAEAFKIWKRLSPDDRADALASVPAFKSYCASRADYRVVHAAKYLSQRRWEGHLKTAKAVRKRVFIHRDSPQWSAWEKHIKSTGGRMPPTDQNGGWYFETEWPPRTSSREHERMSA